MQSNESKNNSFGHRDLTDILSKTRVKLQICTGKN